MEFAGMNYLAIVVAAILAFMAGGVWYGVLGGPWAQALGKNKEDFKPEAKPFITAIVCQLIMAYILAGLIGHLGDITLMRGIIAGLFAWAGFVMTSLATNHGFQKSPLALTLIDGGHWLLVLVIMGGVIGWFGV